MMTRIVSSRRNITNSIHFIYLFLFSFFILSSGRNKKCQSHMKHAQILKSIFTSEKNIDSTSNSPQREQIFSNEITYCTSSYYQNNLMSILKFQILQMNIWNIWYALNNGFNSPFQIDMDIFSYNVWLIIYVICLFLSFLLFILHCIISIYAKKTQRGVKFSKTIFLLKMNNHTIIPKTSVK